MKPSNFLQRIFFGLVYTLPAVLFFSYYPIIRLGGNASMNFELSLPLIWLVVFDLTALILALKQHLLAPILHQRQLYLFGLLPLFATLSLFWTTNLTRATLTVGVLWLVFFAVAALILLLPRLSTPVNFRRNLLRVFFISSALVCGFCWLQCILDINGVAREHSLLCLGCTYNSFGFPHPSGFAIEPQFMGNLLLAPTLTALYLLVFRRQRRALPFALLFSATLFLTFSRGAIYAYAVALLVMFIFALVKHKFNLFLIFVPILTFAFTLCMQGFFNTVSPIRDSFCAGITKSINQLSLGIIDLRNNCPITPGQESIILQVSAERAIPLEIATEIVTHTQSVFDGYVAESTDVRLGLNDVAIRTWLANPRNFLVGVGLGGAGTAMHALFPERITSPKEIVQNQLFSILVELGLVGVLLMLFLLIFAFLAPFLPRKFAKLRPAENFRSHPAVPLLASLIVAYIVTLQFFSGLPNALQIYLMPPLLYYIFQKTLAKSHNV